MKPARVRDTYLIFLFLSLLLLFVAFPFLENSLSSDLLLNLLQVIVVITAINVVSTDRKHFALAALLGTMSLASGWVPRAQEPRIVFLLGAAGGILFQGMAILMIMRYVLRDGRVTYNLLCGALCSYLLMGFLWTDLYDLIGYLQPQSIISLRSPQLRLGWTDFLYLSITTLTALGNSEIIPTSSASRAALMLESICGVFYVTVIVSRLVGLHIAAHQAESIRVLRAARPATLESAAIGRGTEDDSRSQ